MQYSYIQKQVIVADLQSIGGLSVLPIDGVKDLLTIEWPNGLPGVVVPTPSAKAATKADSQHNDRVWTFELYVVFDAGAGTNPYAVEQMIDNIMNTFDADQTLGGTSFPTIDAAVSDSVTLQDGSKQLIVCTITLKVHTLIDVPIEGTTSPSIPTIPGVVFSHLSMEIPQAAVGDQTGTIFTTTYLPLWIEVSGQEMVSAATDPTQYGFTITGNSSGFTITFVSAPQQTPHSWHL